MSFAALGFALLLVLVNGFFVAIEFALVKVRTTSLESLAEQKRPGASLALSMRRNLDSWLSASQVGITLASLALGWVGEPAFSALTTPLLLKLLPESEAAARTAHTISIVLAFATITFLHIVVGEQVPKTIAIAQAERTALALAWPMRLFYLLFFPAIWLLNRGTRMVLALLGLGQTSESNQGEALSEDELKLIFTSSAAAGAIAASRVQLLERALSMVEKTARQCLIPRTQMRCLDLEQSLEENIEAAHGAGHTFLPVIRGSLDRVEGIANVKELYFLLSTGSLKSIAQVQQPVFFVPENVTLEQLLVEFRRRNKQLAVVVDEHGGTSGLITVSDVVAEVVGNVAGLGRRAAPLKALPGGRIELPGTAQLDDIEHTLEIEFDIDHAEVSTVAGYLMAKLGRIPNVGDHLPLGPYRIRAVKVEGPRVVTVRIEPRSETEPL